METDTIFPLSEATWVSIDLQLITITRASEAAKEAAKETLKMATKYISDILESNVDGQLDVP